MTAYKVTCPQCHKEFYVEPSDLLITCVGCGFRDVCADWSPMKTEVVRFGLSR